MQQFNSLKTKEKFPLVDMPSSRGYPAMCKWMASDDDFFVLRRFGGLSARILLRQQDRIVKLEEDLQRVDNMCMINGSNNGTFRYDTNFERQRLLDELTSRLEQFRRCNHLRQNGGSIKDHALI